MQRQIPKAITERFLNQHFEMIDKKIAIIGCGNLGLCILNGLLEQQIIAPSNIIATRRNMGALVHLQEKGIRLTDDNKEAVKESELIIVALKPYNILEVLKTLDAVFDCLLYTSPSPRDPVSSRMPSSA